MVAGSEGGGSPEGDRRPSTPPTTLPSPCKTATRRCRRRSSGGASRPGVSAAHSQGQSTRARSSRRRWAPCCCREGLYSSSPDELAGGSVRRAPCGSLMQQGAAGVQRRAPSTRGWPSSRRPEPPAAAGSCSARRRSSTRPKKNCRDPEGIPLITARRRRDRLIAGHYDHRHAR